MRGQTEKGRNAEQLFSDKVTLSEATLGTGRVLIESVTRSLTPMGLDPSQQTACRPGYCALLGARGNSIRRKVA